MDTIKLDASARTPGKGQARAARRALEVPCVLYGHSFEPVTFQVPELSLRPLIYTSETHRVELSVAGEQYDCILKEMRFHPVTDRPFHADFQVLRKGEMITLTVPVQYHGKPIGVREGGDLQVIMHDLEVTCLPKDIPSHIDVDVTDLAIGDAVHLDTIQLEGVTFSASGDTTLAAVHAPRKLEEVEGEEEETAVTGEEVEEASDEEEG